VLDRQVLLAIALSALLFAPSAVRGDDIADLKATFDQATAALNKQDLDALLVFYHDDYTGFGVTALFLIKGKGALRAVLQPLFATRESTTIIPFDPEYHVIDSTGVVQSYFAATVKPKGGPAATSSARASLTYVKTNGRWLLVASHLSRLPSGE
jgi:uncharacterized protein (TIGR02246 family)